MSERCAQRVYDGSRADFGGHQCQFSAVEGGIYCAQHDPALMRRRLESVEPAPATAAPQVRTRVRQSASFRWEPGEGPYIPIRQGAAVAGWITSCSVSIEWIDGSRHESWSASGVLQKKDGSVGTQKWSDSWSDKRIPTEVQSALVVMAEVTLPPTS